MLRTITPPHSLRLLDFLAPSLISTTRPFSSISIPHTSAPHARSDALQHRKIRDKIMGQGHTRKMAPDSLKFAHNNYMTELRKALVDHDIVEALNLWNEVKKRAATATYEGLFVVPEQLERKLSILYLTQLSKLQENASDAMQAIARGFALGAAANDMSDALYALMLDHIARNEAQAAIDLYVSYQKSIAKPSEQGVENVDSDAGLLFSDEELFNPGRASLLLAVTTAYAMVDSFHDALQTYLTANIRPPNLSTIGIVQESCQ